MRKYNMDPDFTIFPDLGQGATVVLEGTMGTQYNPNLFNVSMVLRIVRMDKKYYILSQDFKIKK